MTKMTTEIARGNTINVKTDVPEKLVGLKIYGKCVQNTTITNLWKNENCIIDGLSSDVSFDGDTIKFVRSQENTSSVSVYITVPVIKGQTYRFGADVEIDGNTSGGPMEYTIYTNGLGSGYYASRSTSGELTLTAVSTKDYVFAFRFYSTCEGCTLSNINVSLVGDLLTEEPTVSPSPINPSPIIETGTYNSETNKYDIVLTATGESESNSVTISLNEPLRSLPNGTKDLLYIENNNVYVARKLGSIILDNSDDEVWDHRRDYNYGTYDNTLYSDSYALENNIMRPGVDTAISSHFVPVVFDTNNTTSTEAFPGSFTGFESSSNKLFMSDKTTIDDFETFLSENNVQVVYELTEPFIETVGEITLPTLYSGNNEITTNSSTEPIIEIEYITGLVYTEIQDEDKIALNSGNCAIKTRLIVSPNTKDELVLTEQNSVKSWEHVEERYVPDVGFIGQFVARELNGELHNISDDFSIDNKQVELQMAVLRTEIDYTFLTTEDGIYLISEDGERIYIEDSPYVVETWYSFGTFVVMEPEDDEVIDNTTFNAMDLTTLFNKEFDPNYTSDTFEKSFNTATNEEKYFTAIDLARYVCEQVGVVFANDVFTHSDFQITSNQFQVNNTCRDVMKAISQLAFGWCRIGWDNKCYIDEIDTTATVSEDDTLTNNQYYSLKTQKVPYGPVNKIYIGMNNVEGGGVEIRDEDSIASNGEISINILDNPLTYTDELLSAAAEGAERLLGLTYYPFETETIGHPWMTTKKPITIVDMENNSRITYPFVVSTKYTGHIKTTIATTLPTKNQEQVGYNKNIYREYKNTRFIVDKQAGTITSLNESVTTVTSDLADNYYTKTQVNKQVNDAVNGITNTYTTGGGNNRLKNTGLYFEDEDNYNDGLVHKYEYWTGDVDVVTDLNSASQTAMILKDNALSQLVDGVPNNKYTISFKYEKLSELAIATVSINSITYTLDDGGTFTQTFDVGGNSIEVIFNCDVPSGYKIYELMCNVGTEPLVWVQHPDEMRTDTVNISKGITITSTASNATFKAGASGIQIINTSNRKTTEFLETGMVTDNATINDQAKITGSLFTKIGRQTWINGL